MGADVMTEPARTLGQNDMFHGLCEDIARSWTFAGRAMSPCAVKVLMISAHRVATAGGGHGLAYGLEGELVDVRESSARMSAARSSSLVEFVMAWMVQHGIKSRYF